MNLPPWIWPFNWHLRIRKLEAMVLALKQQNKALATQLAAESIANENVAAAYVAAMQAMVESNLNLLREVQSWQPMGIAGDESKKPQKQDDSDHDIDDCLYDWGNPRYLTNSPKHETNDRQDDQKGQESGDHCDTAGTA